MHATLDEWIARESIPLSLDGPADAFDGAVDRVMARLGPSVELLGFGEAMHGAEELLVLRNRLFRRLVETHGFTAIAIESSFPRGRVIDDYINGRGPASTYDDVRDAGITHGLGPLEANRALVEWMRAYNADAAHAVKLRFDGFDSPTEMTGPDSPRQLLSFALDYLARVDGDAITGERRRRVDELLGADADWENPAAMMDPSKSIGRSPRAASLRVEAQDLVTHLQCRRPELVEKTGRDAHLEALQHAIGGRLLLDYHAGLAGQSPTRIADLLGIRDLTMAENLAYTVERERGRGGKVFAFAHNSHLKCGQATWQLGPHALAWWPAGAHVRQMLGERYAVIGTGVGTSAENGIAEPEPGTLEAHLTASGGTGWFVPTHNGRAVNAEVIASLPTRTPSTRNHGYFPFTAQSLTDFDWLVVLGSVTYNRGGRPLP